MKRNTIHQVVQLRNRRCRRWKWCFDREVWWITEATNAYGEWRRAACRYLKQYYISAGMPPNIGMPAETWCHRKALQQLRFVSKGMECKVPPISILTNFFVRRASLKIANP